MLALSAADLQSLVPMAEAVALMKMAFADLSGGAGIRPDPHARADAGA